MTAPLNDAAWERDSAIREQQFERLSSVAAGLAQSPGQTHPDTLAADYALHAHVAEHPSSGIVDVRLKYPVTARRSWATSSWAWRA
ncbi:hypothetical protein [Streptomyces lincolnensis]|uniref:hypothetical protein n=1 Tax=Streptomyces lincolnensis TaxID=1915 RepID=UPI000835B42F|nr:hypothetical protein [Streptomyces lincolnensis]QMV04382.1 hypothetical protein GJU35_00975 [Streptomyces lincolnensis]QMV11942.1 hypothetical protein GJU35_43945 [Streptomyces lincolnensis]